MLGPWDTAAASGVVGLILFASYFTAATRQLCIYVTAQRSRSIDFSLWDNKFLFLISIAAWALLESVYNIGLFVNDSITAWAYSCHAIALTAVLVAFCQVILYWSKVLSFRGQYKKARSVIRKVVIANIALVILTIIMLGISGSYNAFADNHPQFNAVFQIEEGACMLLLSAWMLWYGLYLQRRFMHSTAGTSLQDPVGLARVTAKYRYTDTHSDIESLTAGNGHDEGQNNEVRIDPSASLFDDAKQYEDSLLGHRNESGHGQNSTWNRQNTFVTQDTLRSTPSRAEIERSGVTSVNVNVATISRLSVIVRINGALTTCCVCFFLRVVLLLLAAVDSIFNRRVTDHMLWLLWFLLSSWIPLLLPGCILLHLMRPTDAQPMDRSGLSQSLLFTYSDINRESFYGHPIAGSSSGTASSSRSEDNYEISDYGESASLSTVSVTTDRRRDSDDDFGDAYVPPDFSSRRSGQINSYNVYSEV